MGSERQEFLARTRLLIAREADSPARGSGGKAGAKLEPCMFEDTFILTHR